MRVLVCGGRDFNNQKALDEVLQYFDIRYNFTTLINGGATGADRLAAEWAGICGKNRITVETYPADWNTHGKAAGPIRNSQMLDEGKPDLVIAFDGGKGTDDMVNKAISAGIEVIRWRENV